MTAHVVRAVAHLGRVYRQPETGAHYDWRLGVLTAFAVAGPLVVGELSGHLAAGTIAALAAWFLGLMVPPSGAGRRFFEFGRRAVITTAATGLGVALAGHPLAVAAALAALALFIPTPGMTITPLICLIMGLNTPPVLSAGQHVMFFAAGAAWGLLVFSLNWSAPQAAAPRHQHLSTRQAILGHFATRTSATHYATQVAVVLPVCYLLLTHLRWAHAPWVLIGLLTTLRGTWEATEARMVKRSIGMVAGSVITALALVLTGMSTWASMAMIALYGAVARPFRQYNYGYWPILGTPVLLLLINFCEPLHLVDSVWRLGNNLLGALLTLATVTFLWPHNDQRPPRIARR